MILRSLCLGVLLISGQVAVAQTPPVTFDVSDKTLRTLKVLAWQSLPRRILQSDKRVLEIDKSDPSKIIIPDEDAREVVRAASLTARARKCALQDLVIANRDALMLREKKSGRWTESQLQYINILHLFTVQLLAGKMEAMDADKLQPEGGSAPPPVSPVSAANCDEKEKQEISNAVEASGKPGKS